MTENPPISGFDPARAFRAMEQFGHIAALGLRYVDHGANWTELTIPWRADLIGDQLTQTIATGALITLMDMASGMAVWTTLGQFRPVATLDLRVDYLRAAQPRSAIIGRVECYRLASEIAFVRGIAHDGSMDDPVAHVAASFMFTGPPMHEAAAIASRRSASAASQ